jgi:hypothetical protein
MRGRGLALALAALPFTLTGCGGNATPTASASQTPTGDAWVVVQTGSPTPSATGSQFTGTPPPALPSVSFLPTDSGCGQDYPDTGLVLIPMVVTPIAGGFKVSWPSKYGSYYRITAVLQGLVTGAQPEPTWQTVNATGGCTVSATISGLKSGAPYIIWLDAPDTPRGIDGTRSLYSGKTGVVKPL